MTSEQDNIPPAAKTVEQADLAVARAVAPLRKTAVVRVLGTLSEVGDQPELGTLCAGLIAAGLWRGDRRLTGAGVRMLAALGAATALKTLIKNRVDRTRPKTMVEEGRYELRPGGSHEPEDSSFPSGHTAGAMAVAWAFGHVYPEYRIPALISAGAVALMQIPRCKHYLSDVGAGAAIGLLSGAAVNAAGAALGD